MVTKTKKIRVGILAGGPSQEHDVSLSSALEVSQNLESKTYTSEIIKIEKSGRWPKGITPHNFKERFDVAFIAMHGAYGEDGTIQAILQVNGIPHTGSGVMASALAMDKWRSGLVAQQIGLRVPESLLSFGQKIDLRDFANKIILKPNTGGSSLGVSIINKKSAKNKIGTIKEPVLIQDFISGRELTVSVLGETNPHALSVIEIIPKAKFYDYHSKYNSGGSEHIIPAKISSSLTQKLQVSAKEIHIALGCKGATRSDFLLTTDNQLYYLETNTIPGMTPTSLLPQAALFEGISFSSLLDLLIASAL